MDIIISGNNRYINLVKKLDKDIEKDLDEEVFFKMIEPLLKKEHGDKDETVVL